MMFGLDLLVAADIIQTLSESVHALTFSQLGKASALVAIRIVLSYHLQHGYHEAEHDMEEIAHQRNTRKKTKKHHRMLSRGIVPTDLSIKIPEKDDGDRHASAGRKDRSPSSGSWGQYAIEEEPHSAH